MRDKRPRRSSRRTMTAQRRCQVCGQPFDPSSAEESARAQSRTEAGSTGSSDLAAIHTFPTSGLSNPSAHH